MLLLKITYLHDNIRKVRIQALGVIDKGFRLNNDQLVNICHGDVVKEVRELAMLMVNKTNLLYHKINVLMMKIINYLFNKDKLLTLFFMI